jgi:hypothetical protein
MYMISYLSTTPSHFCVGLLLKRRRRPISRHNVYTYTYPTSFFLGHFRGRPPNKEMGVLPLLLRWWGGSFQFSFPHREREENKGEKRGWYFDSLTGRRVPLLCVFFRKNMISQLVVNTHLKCRQQGGRLTFRRLFFSPSSSLPCCVIIIKWECSWPTNWRHIVGGSTVTRLAIQMRQGCVQLEK